jgi:hypothetical protein
MGVIPFEILNKFKAELLKISDRFVVISATKIPPTERNLIVDAVGTDVPFKWEVGIKPSTIENLMSDLTVILRETQLPSVRIERQEKDRHLSLTLRPVVETDNDFDTTKVWDVLCKYLIADGYLESWDLNPGNWSYNVKVNKALSANKSRDRAITAQDVQDVLILVNAAKTVDEFIKSI